MFRTIGLVISWLPAIVSIVSVIEQVFGDSDGKAKKEAAMRALRKVLETANVVNIDNVMSVMSTVIDAVVSILNFLGVSGFADSEDSGQETYVLVAPEHIEQAENSARAKYAEIDAELEKMAAQMKATE